MTSPTAPITGSIVALVTPMHADGSVDYPTLRKLIDWHIAEGTDCIGVVGTTGESPTVNVEEHQRDHSRGSSSRRPSACPSWPAAAPTPRLKPSSWGKFAKKVGADCQLQVVPYYNKPTQEGQYQHFKAIAEATGDLPIVPVQRARPQVADMLHDTVLRLAQVPGIIGIKEATGNIERAQWLIRDVPKGFAVYLGRRPHGRGADAVRRPRQHQRHRQRGAAPDARVVRGRHRRATSRSAMQIQFQLMPVHKQLFVEANPIPVKWAMARMGLMRRRTCGCR
jgi:4-hydroxy-tetrahydrodipicolinate synthase